MSDQSPIFNAPNILNVVMRHKKKIVLFPLFTLVAGALFFVFCPRTYRSEARLFLRVGRESVGIDPTATTGQTMQLYTADRKDEVKSAEGVFRSRSVNAQVVDRLGPDVVLGRGGGDAKKPNLLAAAVGKPIGALLKMIRSLDPISVREEAIIKVERSLNVTAERQATVIILQYDADSPQLAQTVCQAIVEIAQREHMRVHRNDEARLFFTEQQKRLREQLDESLEALRNAKNEMGLASVEQRRTTLETQFSAIALDRLSTNQQLATSGARIEELKRQIAEVPDRLISSKRSVPNNGADMLRDRFYELQVKSMDLSARYSDSHPLVLAVNEQLDEAQKVLAEQSEQRIETTDDLNPIHRDLTLALKQEQSVVEGFKARLDKLDEQTNKVLADLRAVNLHDLQIDHMTRDADLARDKYLQYARNMEEARIDKELENQKISNIGVIQQATLTEKPVSPTRKLTAAVTMLLATAGTFALVLIGEWRNLPPSPAAAHAKARRFPRRRERASKTNGHVETAELRSPPR